MRRIILTTVSGYSNVAPPLVHKSYLFLIIFILKPHPKSIPLSILHILTIFSLAIKARFRSCVRTKIFKFVCFSSLPSKSKEIFSFTIINKSKATSVGSVFVLLLFKWVVLTSYYLDTKVRLKFFYYLVSIRKRKAARILFIV